MAHQLPDVLGPGPCGVTLSSTSLPFSVLRTQSQALLSLDPVGLEGAVSYVALGDGIIWSPSMRRACLHHISAGTVLGMA